MFEISKHARVNNHAIHKCQDTATGVLRAGVALGISDGGADSSDMGAKIQFIRCKK